MKKIKTKLIALAITSAIITLGYSTAASADSVNSAVKATAPNPPLAITPRSNVEFQGGSTLNGWYFWMNSGPYTIFRNKYTGEYRTIQTQGTISYMLGVIASGWGTSWHP